MGEVGVEEGEDLCEGEGIELGAGNDFLLWSGVEDGSGDF